MDLLGHFSPVPVRADSPTMTATLQDVQRGPDGFITSERLARLEAQAKSTHGWVVFIGWIVVMQATLAICLGAFTWARLDRDRSTARANTSSTTAVIACINAGRPTADCLAGN